MFEIDFNFGQRLALWRQDYWGCDDICIVRVLSLMSLNSDVGTNYIAKESHQIAQATAEKNARIKEAFGIGENYVDGSSFDPNRKAKEDQAKAVAMAQKKYASVPFPFTVHGIFSPYLVQFE